MQCSGEWSTQRRAVDDWSSSTRPIPATDAGRTTRAASRASAIRPRSCPGRSTVVAPDVAAAPMEAVRRCLARRGRLVAMRRDHGSCSGLGPAHSAASAPRTASSRRGSAAAGRLRVPGAPPDARPRLGEAARGHIADRVGPRRSAVVSGGTGRGGDLDPTTDPVEEACGALRRADANRDSEWRSAHAHVPDARRLRRGDARRRSKPIEGVGTSVAAFVGLAPGGPVNTPMRISNWTQFAQDLRRPAEPRQRAVHGGRLPRALRLRLLPERRQPVLGRPRRRRRGRRRSPRAALPAAADTERRGASASIALDGVDRARSRSSSARSRRARRARTDDKTYKLVVSAGTASARSTTGLSGQEGPHQHRHQGQRRFEADQDRGDRRLAARGPAHPGNRAPTRCRRRRCQPTRSRPSDFEGDVAERKGMGGFAAVDEITMVCMPDLMTLGQERRRRRAAARRPGQDDRPLRERRRPHGDPRRAAGPAARRTSSSGG